MIGRALTRTPERVGVAGDWDGNFLYARQALARAREFGVDHVVQLGDFGYWPAAIGSSFLRRLERELSAHDQTLWFVDGNHEDFGRLLSRPVDPVSGLRPISSRIAHLPRGLRWRWHDRTWLAFGGATSLDRKLRVPGRSWWPEEVQSDAERSAVRSGGRADVMVTHDCPSGVRIPGLWDGWDPQELAIARRHQEQLREVVEAVRPSLLLHGHFHLRYDGRLTYSDDVECRVVGLADDRSPVLSENLIAVETRSLRVLS